MCVCLWGGGGGVSAPQLERPLLIRPETSPWIWITLCAPPSLDGPGCVTLQKCLHLSEPEPQEFS